MYGNPAAGLYFVFDLYDFVLSIIEKVPIALQ